MLECNIFGLETPQVWDTKLAFHHLQKQGLVETKRTAERRLHELNILPKELKSKDLQDEFGQSPISCVLDWEIEEARNKRKVVLFVQLADLPNKLPCLHANNARGGRYWIPLTVPINQHQIEAAFSGLQQHIAKPIVIFPHGTVTRYCRQFQSLPNIGLGMLSYMPSKSEIFKTYNKPNDFNLQSKFLTYLDQLEAESIYILREAVAEAENPVMLYSLGKDSSVMLHLARKAFYPSLPPFPLLHVDTRWKFQEMYSFRDYMARESGMELLVYTNPEAIAKNINPFDHGSALHTDITKTMALKQALDKYQFDIIFGGARRDEEKSRAKERIFSFRTETHYWDPKNQRPEVWNLYNTRKNRKESIRVFPLSNWTELDVWQYIYRENIPVVPLYFAKERPVVVRDGMILMVNDNRMKLFPEEIIQRRMVRFRTLGCYPLTGAIDSKAESLPQIILELVNARNSERQGRAIDMDHSSSMERKKQEGYF